MLEVRGAAKAFGGQLVLDRVHVTVEPGEFFSLLGPSGCGKTTLLRIIAGFEQPDAGAVRIGGADVTAVPPHLRPCNLVFQRYALFPHLNVGDNVAFGLRVKGLSKSELATRRDEALSLVSLEGFAGRSVETLSGGQQQRVAIARAIANRPQVLLLDEPLSALDLKLRQRMQVELLALQRRLGMTFVYVTHAQDEALTLSDRVAVMNGGLIEQIGSPQEVYDRPATAFVATFIGSMNRLPARISAARGDRAVTGNVPDEDGNGALELSGQPIGAAAGGAPMAPAMPATFMVRPEKVRVNGPDGTAVNGENRCNAVVERSLFRGSSYEIHARLEAVPGVLFTALLGSRCAAGERVGLTFDVADTLVLPGEVPP